MPSLNQMTTGQTQKFHVKAYAQDNAHGTSTNIDTTTTLTASVNFTTIATVAPDPSDNRAFIVTAVGIGIATITLNESPALPAALTLTVNCVAPTPPDNRRIDFLSADPPA